MRCHLLRHGAVVPPRPGAFYGARDVPLSPAGLAEARRAAAALADAPLRRVWASPLGRARRGAQLVAARHGLPVLVLPGLVEVDRGAWTGCTPEEIRRQRPGELEAASADPAGFRPPGGESLGDLRERVLETWAELRREALAQAPGEVAVVAHLWSIRAVVAAVLGLEIRDWPALRVPTGSITALELAADGAGRDRLEALGRRPENGRVRSAARPA